MQRQLETTILTACLTLLLCIAGAAPARAFPPPKVAPNEVRLFTETNWRGKSTSYFLEKEFTQQAVNFLPKHFRNGKIKSIGMGSQVKIVVFKSYYLRSSFRPLGKFKFFIINSHISDYFGWTKHALHWGKPPVNSLIILPRNQQYPHGMMAWGRAPANYDKNGVPFDRFYPVPERKGSKKVTYRNILAIKWDPYLTFYGKGLYAVLDPVGYDPKNIPQNTSTTNLVTKIKFPFPNEKLLKFEKITVNRVSASMASTPGKIYTPPIQCAGHWNSNKGLEYVIQQSGKQIKILRHPTKQERNPNTGAFVQLIPVGSALVEDNALVAIPKKSRRAGKSLGRITGQDQNKRATRILIYENNLILSRK